MLGAQMRITALRLGDTSFQARLSIEPILSQLEAIVLKALRDNNGLTCDELERITRLKHQTASARLRELVVRGLVYDTGVKRKTSSGRAACVWRAVNERD
jgi:predicted transcriptional regulator